MTGTVVCVKCYSSFGRELERFSSTPLFKICEYCGEHGEIWLSISKSRLDEIKLSQHRNFGFLRQDDDGHWYLVPEKEIEDFEKLQEKILSERSYSEEWENLVNEFIEKYDDYRLSGGVRDLKVVIE